MTHEVIFDSAKYPAGEILGLACGYVSLTEISFINEKVTVTIEAKTGEIAFYDLQANSLLSAKAQPPVSGDEKFSEVKCLAEGDQIKLGFPQYTYKDNYPHCDGENDRWTKTVSGFCFISYDLKNNCIVEA